MMCQAYWIGCQLSLIDLEIGQVDVFQGLILDSIVRIDRS